MGHGQVWKCLYGGSKNFWSKRDMSHIDFILQLNDINKNSMR